MGLSGCDSRPPAELKVAGSTPAGHPAKLAAPIRAEARNRLKNTGLASNRYWAELSERRPGRGISANRLSDDLVSKIDAVWTCWNEQRVCSFID